MPLNLMLKSWHGSVLAINLGGSNAAERKNGYALSPSIVFAISVESLLSAQCEIKDGSLLTPNTSPSELSSKLRVELKHLNFIVYKKRMIGSYESFDIEKKNGERRTIDAPKRSLKSIQSKLYMLLDELFKPHEAATAFIKDKGIIFNAKKHIKNKYVFNLDLSDFFGSIHFGRVFGLLCSPPYSLRKDTAHLIANLCCYNGKLPQGAPTSPLISNMICKSFDRDLSYLAKKSKAYYTRYADDITFSFNNLNDQLVVLDSNVSPYLTSIISSHGFQVNLAKTRLQSSSERQVVTGLKVNRKVNVDRRYIRTTRAMIHSMSQSLDQARADYIAKTGNENSLIDNVVHGRISFIGMVKGRDSTVFKGLALRYNALCLDLKIRIKKDGNGLINFDFVYKSHKTLLERSIFVVDFEGYQEDGSEIDEYVQGTAFYLPNGFIVTAAHTFSKAGAKDGGLLSYADQHDKKYAAKLIYRDDDRDIALLKFADEQDKPKELKGLSIAEHLEFKPGYELLLAGAPKYASYHRQLSLIPSKVIKANYVRSLRECINIDCDIEGGASGAPVLNAYCQVVGMALQGRSVDLESRTLDGENTFISAKHILEAAAACFKKGSD